MASTSIISSWSPRRGAEHAPVHWQIEYTPNVDAALRAGAGHFPRIRAAVPTAQLWLVASAPPPELQALASDAITVTGNVPDKRAYLQRAAAFCLAAAPGRGHQNKVLEALALCAPVSLRR